MFLPQLLWALLGTPAATKYPTGTGQLADAGWTLVRNIPGAIAADSVVLNDETLSPGNAIDCTGLESIWIMVNVTVPGTATMVLEALYRDNVAADGLRWVRNSTAAGLIKTPALASQVAFELVVDGSNEVFLRVDSVANAGGTTNATILARPGKIRRRAAWR